MASRRAPVVSQRLPCECWGLWGRADVLLGSWLAVGLLLPLACFWLPSMAAAASSERLPPLLLSLLPSALWVQVPLRAWLLLVVLLWSQLPSGAALLASQPGHVARLLREGERVCWAGGVACKAAC